MRLHPEWGESTLTRPVEEGECELCFFPRQTDIDHSHPEIEEWQ